MPDSVTYDDLDPRDQALIDEAGGGNVTVVSARMVKALNGNGNAAIYLSQLLWWGSRKADEDGWFFRTREQMQERCGLGKQAQRTAEKTLTSMGLLETDKRGMPAKKHFRLHFSSIVSALAGDEPDTAPTPQDKSRDLGGGTSSGTYPQEQVAGGRCGNPIESNTESNTKSERSAPARGDDDSGEVKEMFETILSVMRDTGTMTRRLESKAKTLAQSLAGEYAPTIVENALREDFDGSLRRWNSNVFEESVLPEYVESVTDSQPDSAQDNRSNGQRVHTKPDDIRSAVR